jgi:hypothetical protein
MRTPVVVPEDRDRNGFAERRSVQRVLAAKALATARKLNAADILRAAWPGDGQAAMLLKAASPPLTTGDYPQIQTTAMLRNLAPSSAALKLFADSLQIDLGGITSVSVPHIAPAPLAVFIGEGQPMPLLNYTVGKTTVGPMRKILFGIAVSREVNESTPGTAAVVLGEAMNAHASRSLDAVAFGTAAATANQPAGLLNGVTPLTASTQTATLDAAIEDVAALAGAIGAANIDPTDMVVVASPKQAAVLRLLPAEQPYQVHASLALADKTVCGFAPAAIGAAFAEPELTSSLSAAIHMEDSAPLALVGSAGVVATPQRGVFQTDCIAIKCRARACWAVVAPGGAQMVTNTSW